MYIDYLSNYADILAIPLFALLVYYFYNIQEKSVIEYILFYFAILGFVFDILFSYQFLSKKNN